MMKKWISLALMLCLLLCTVAGCAGNAIFSYNGESLDADLLRYQVFNTKLGLETQTQILDEASADAYWAADNTADLIEGKTPFEYASTALVNEVKEELMIVRMAEDRNVSASEEDIATMNSMLKTQMFGSEEGYQQTAEIFGFTEENLDWIAKVNASYANIIADLYPREKLAAYAEENGWVRVKHVLINFSETVTEEDALKKAQEVCDRAANGEDFDAMVTELSEDPGSTTYADGYLVAVDSGMVKSFETAALALKEGEVSTPVKSDYGYHVIKRYPIGTVSDLDLSMGTALTTHYQEEATTLFQTELDAAMAEHGDEITVDTEAFEELIRTLKVPQEYYDAMVAAQQSYEQSLQETETETEVPAE